MSKSRVKKGVKLSEKSLQSRFANPKLRKRGLVRFFEQGGGPLADKWDKHQFELKLVNPANKRKYDIIVVGTGLAGGSAAATLA